MCASFVALLLKYGALLKQIEALENTHNLEKQADHNSGVLFRLADMADQLRIATAENTASIEAMRREMGHLSDEVRGEGIAAPSKWPAVAPQRQTSQKRRGYPLRRPRRLSHFMARNANPSVPHPWSHFEFGLPAPHFVIAGTSCCLDECLFPVNADD